MEENKAHEDQAQK
jgi:hypothetical protein